MKQYKMLYRLFDIPYLGNIIKKIVTNYTGGEKESRILRDYTKKRFHVDVGLYTYGFCFRAPFCIGGRVKIGRYCSIANNVFYIGDSHPVNYLSTSPYFFQNHFSREIREVTDVPHSDLIIGNDVWIGTNVTILKNVNRIGNGAIIGAGSIVTKDVPPYAIVAGNPAAILRYRFDEDLILQLEDSFWWDYPPDILLQYYDFIDRPAKMLECLTEKERR